MNNFSSPTLAELIKAVSIKVRIETLTSELNALLSSSSAAVKPIAKPAKKGGMSAAGKAKIAAAQKLRWAKVKKSQPVKPTIASKVIAKLNTKPVAKKRTMSAAAKAKIAAAAKARWAKAKASGKTTL